MKSKNKESDLEIGEVNKDRTTCDKLERTLTKIERICKTVVICTLAGIGVGVFCLVIKFIICGR